MERKKRWSLKQFTDEPFKDHYYFTSDSLTIPTPLHQRKVTLHQSP